MSCLLDGRRLDYGIQLPVLVSSRWPGNVYDGVYSATALATHEVEEERDDDTNQGKSSYNAAGDRGCFARSCIGA